MSRVFSLTLESEVSNYTLGRLGTLCAMGDGEMVFVAFLIDLNFITVDVAVRLSGAFVKLRQHV